jgi:hypothetical protein
MRRVGRIRAVAAIGASALMLAGALGRGSGAVAEPPHGSVSISVASLSPVFDPNIHDYVVRCNDGPVTVQAHASNGWRVSVGGKAYRGGDFSQGVALSEGRSFTVKARKSGAAQVSRYYVRCLPDGFPAYSFTHSRQGSPRLFSVDEYTTPIDQRYAMIFDNHGVPLWWDRASFRMVRPSGTAGSRIRSRCTLSTGPWSGS